MSIHSDSFPGFTIDKGETRILHSCSTSRTWKYNTSAKRTRMVDVLACRMRVAHVVPPRYTRAIRRTLIAPAMIITGNHGAYDRCQRLRYMRTFYHAKPRRNGRTCVRTCACACAIAPLFYALLSRTTVREVIHTR